MKKRSTLKVVAAATILAFAGLAQAAPFSHYKCLAR